MTHENIQHPDDHQFDVRELETLKLLAERDYYRRRYERACADLRSICDRVQNGDRVYFVLRSGQQVDLARVPTK